MVHAYVVKQNDGSWWVTLDGTARLGPFTSPLVAEKEAISLAKVDLAQGTMATVVVESEGDHLVFGGLQRRTVH